MSTERDIESINASLKQVGEQLKSYNDQAQQDIKAHAKLSEETRAKVDELLTRQGELSANLQSAEQKLAQIEQGGVHAVHPAHRGLLALAGGSARHKLVRHQHAAVAGVRGAVPQHAGKGVVVALNRLVRPDVPHHGGL